MCYLIFSCKIVRCHHLSNYLLVSSCFSTCFFLLGTCAHRKVVRRASLSDRHNLCRKEYETEAIVWRGGREEEDEKEKESDQENSQVVNVRLFFILTSSFSLVAIFKDCISNSVILLQFWALGVFCFCGVRERSVRRGGIYHPLTYTVRCQCMWGIFKHRSKGFEKQKGDPSHSSET